MVCLQLRLRNIIHPYLASGLSRERLRLRRSLSRRAGVKGGYGVTSPPLSAFIRCITLMTRYGSAVHQAYLPIVAASTRAATLHYCCNDREFAWGPLAEPDHVNRATFTHEAQGSRLLLPQVLLIDAGCEWGNYASDSMSCAPPFSSFFTLIGLSHAHDARGQRRQVYSGGPCHLRTRARDANGMSFIMHIN